ncbi:MAG: hypothetical protein QXR53_04875 [Candidatus Norongarragalinales archaeon]
MNVDFSVIAPVFFLVLSGFALRKTGLIDADFGKKLLDFTLLIPIAASAFLSIAKLRVSAGDLLLPFSAFFFVGVMLVAGRVLSKALGLANVKAAVFRLSLLILNTAFVLIFAIPMLGPEGVQKVFLMVLGASPLIFSVVYAVAAESSPKNKGKLSSEQLVRRILSLPPFFFSVFGLLFVLFQWDVPVWLSALLLPLDSMSFPLLAISTGIFLQPSFSNSRVIAVSVITKMGLGFALGLAFTWFFEITGVAKAVLLAVFSSPVGFNTVAYSAREDLDLELAASLFFVSALIGLFTVPAVFLLFS